MGKENGLPENLKPDGQVVRRPPRPSGGGAGPRAGPGGRGGLGAARSAGPSPPLALRRAALRSCRLGVVEARRRGRGGGGGCGGGEGGGGGGGGSGARPGGLAVGLRPRLSGGGRELCGGRGSSKWRHVDPRRNRAVVVPEDISHPVPAHWLRGATFTHTPAPASARSRRRHSKGQPRRPASPRAGPAAGAPSRGAPAGPAGHRGVSLSSFKETLTLRFPQRPSRTSHRLGLT